MVGPNYHRPDVPVAEASTRSSLRKAGPRPRPSDAAPKGDWWTDFHDPLLDELEPKVAVSNQTVRQDYANYLQAVAEVQSRARAAVPDARRSRARSPERADPATRRRCHRDRHHRHDGHRRRHDDHRRGRQPARHVTSATLEGTASWTLDIWGQVRRLIEENTAIAQSDEATLANATLSEQTLLATTVIELRLADANIDLEQKTVDAYRECAARHQGAGRRRASPRRRLRR